MASGRLKGNTNSTALSFAAQDKVFVHWKNIQTDDRFPRLQQGLQRLGRVGAPAGTMSANVASRETGSGAEFRQFLTPIDFAENPLDAAAKKNCRKPTPSLEMCWP